MLAASCNVEYGFQYLGKKNPHLFLAKDFYILMQI